MKTILKWIQSLILWPVNLLFAHEKTRDEILVEEEKLNMERSKRYVAAFYTMSESEDCKEITEAVLQNSETKVRIKEQITTTGRRFFVFKYPSDGLQVKGTISFVPNPDENPLLISLRGGNRLFGLQHPAADITCIKNYTVLSTCYRGGVCEGTDEYGGDDVNDVDNLMNYFPIIQKKIGIHISTEQIYILGGSRGGMEMFLALSRFPSLQQVVKKAASLSGMLDLEECLVTRPDMIRMFTNDFGLIPGENEIEWKKRRDPIQAVSSIRNDLPFLILQGEKDIRVDLQEGLNMVKKLEENGNPVTYLEFSEGDHCLMNTPNRMDIIADWFEERT